MYIRASSELAKSHEGRLSFSMGQAHLSVVMMSFLAGRPLQTKREGHLGQKMTSLVVHNAKDQNLSPSSLGHSSVDVL